jgi:HAD superfamily hydrolase (TIGR01509 family)
MFSLERPDMRLIIEDLSKQFRMVLISDISKESAESILEAHPFLSQLFPQQIFSFEQGLLKRDSKGFSTMLEKYDINPTESLLIDDSEGNISLARSLGARAIHFQSPSQLLRALGETDIRNSLPLRLEKV